MAPHDEHYRLRNFRRGERPSSLHTTITFACSETNEKCIDRITSVMGEIVQFRAENWPSDDYWREKLPEWLLRTFKIYTPEELIQIRADRGRWADVSWTFGSWLDRMRDRDWEWWSYESQDGQTTIYLVIQGHPFTARALEHLVSAAGGRLQQA